MRTALAAVVIAVTVAPACAANSQTTTANPPTAPQAGPSGQQVAQQVRKNLQDAGFSDIQLMPSSFMVRAKDKSGNPVMMVINPDSVTAVTELKNGQSNSSSSTDQQTSGPGSHH
jgi:hypothetical protein